MHTFATNEYVIENTPRPDTEIKLLETSYNIVASAWSEGTLV